jgi:hypothetical protein
VVAKLGSCHSIYSRIDGEREYGNDCWSCHDQHAAVEHTFVQFYPTLKPVAKNLGTYNEVREKVRQELDMNNVQDKAANSKEKPKHPFPVVPTTKILAIGQFTKVPTPEQMKELFPKEVPATLRLYLAGKIDQWWIRQTQTGPVFLLNVTSLEEARALMEELPLGQAGLMKHEFIELGPLTPLHLLLASAGARNEDL